MNTRLTIGLLVVLILLGGYVIWSGNGADDASDTGEDGTVPAGTAAGNEEQVLALDPAAIRSVEVQGLAGQQVRLTKRGDGWRLMQPTSAAADTLQVTQAITDIARLTATRAFTPTEQDLSAYGLAQPLAEITLGGEDSTLARLHLGTQNPTGSAIYVQRAGSPVVYLVPGFNLATLQGWLSTPPLRPTPAPTPAPLPTPTPTS